MKKLTARQKRLIMERRSRALQVINVVGLWYPDRQTRLRDMLADLMHLQKDFEAELEVARGHYQAEINGED